VTREMRNVEGGTLDVRSQKTEVGGLRSEIRGRSDGFSLMEIMVVVVVISILVGLLFPALLGARERVRINSARGEVFELQKAWTMYALTYPEADMGRFSVMDSSTTGELAGDNPNGITFMEFEQDDLDNGFEDPWKRPYELDFEVGADVVTRWAFQTRVQCVGAKRYKY
jgi:prepilin-type N-terminal cleavage/methylation domain-containing protein